MCNNHTDSILNFYTLCKMDRSWFWFKNTIVPFPIGHGYLCPRWSPCPQAQQCAAIDLKTIPAQALEKKKKKRVQLHTTAPRLRCVERLRRLLSLHVEYICSIWVTHTVQYQNGKWDKIRETLGATVFPANVVVWIWKFLLCWREKNIQGPSIREREGDKDEWRNSSHPLPGSEICWQIFTVVLLMFWLQIFKYSLALRKTLVRLLWQKKIHKNFFVVVSCSKGKTVGWSDSPSKYFSVLVPMVEASPSLHTIIQARGAVCACSVGGGSGAHGILVNACASWVYAGKVFDILVHVHLQSYQCLFQGLLVRVGWV